MRAHADSNAPSQRNSLGNALSVGDIRDASLIVNEASPEAVSRNLEKTIEDLPDFSEAVVMKAWPLISRHVEHIHHNPEPSYGFELASYALPAFRQGHERALRQSVDDEAFARVVNSALHPMVEQLPLGAALVTEYIFLAKDDGAVSLTFRLLIDASPSDVGNLRNELAVCLATLSDYFGFRVEASCHTANQWKSTETLVVRPTTISFGPRSGSIGFTGEEVSLETVRLPVPEITPGQTSNMGASPRSLSNFIKAARATRHSLRVRIRMTREHLSATTSHMLEKLLKQDSVPLDANMEMPRIGQMTLLRQLEGWAESSGDVLRLAVEADYPAPQAPASSLLRILAAELYPGLRVEIVAKNQLSISVEDAIDLGGVIPLSGPLPPMLPSPYMLEAMDFARHFVNPRVSLPAHGMLLGHAQLAAFERPVRIAESDRSRHMYLLGATGTGKSTLILNMIRQDMEAGHGVALIDPHGDLFDQVLASVPTSRHSDLIIIDPHDPRFPVGLNPFDFDGAPSVSKANRVINDFLDIFSELWNMREAGGPSFEMYFRNTYLLACTTPENAPPAGLPKGPPTLLTASEVMRDRAFRKRLLAGCQTSFLGADVGGEVARFFQSAHEVSGDHSFANWVPYVTSKVARFTNNLTLRKLMCSPKRTVNFRAAMDSGAIILVKLNKGSLGELDARMIGMLITKYLFHAALSRADQSPEARRPFYLYLDEFQNFVTRDIPGMLAEARKFRLHLILAHQTLGQLKEQGPASTLDALLGNIATRLYFRVGLQEAHLLENEFLPYFDGQTISTLPDRYVLARLLVHNKPTPAFIFETPWCDCTVSIRPDIEITAHPLAHPEVTPSSGNHEQQGHLNSHAALFRNTLKIKSDTDYPVNTSEIRTRIAKSMKRWRCFAQTTGVASITPEVGRFYQTRNGSLVFVYRRGAENKYMALVLTGGHLETGLDGDVPGSIYRLQENGLQIGDFLGANLLGMDLLKKARIAFREPKIFSSKLDVSCQWLFSRRANQICGVSSPIFEGFYKTLNNSVVFVFRKATPTRPAVAIVCSGGHMVSSLAGAYPGELYRIDPTGAFLNELEYLEKLTTPVLAQTTGMSLAIHMPLVGNVPKNLCSGDVHTPSSDVKPSKQPEEASNNA
jgi:hypothetical protein